MKEAFRQVELKMKQPVDHLHQEMKHLRTGRASIGLIEGVMVEYYGTPVPIQQVANLLVPEATLIVAQPYDPTVIPAIERAIMKSDLGLNPSSDGKLVRIPVPPLTEERRREIVKKAHELAEAARNAVRHARREGNEALKQKEKEGEIGQDDERRGHDEIQKLHDHYIAEINQTLEKKEKDILTV